jgi:hypothetical protein
MMEKDELIGFIRGVFPNISENEIIKMINSSEPIEVLIHRRLEEEKSERIEVKLSLNECLYNLNKHPRIKSFDVKAIDRSNLHYKEIFMNEYIDTSVDVNELRERARGMYDLAKKNIEMCGRTQMKGGLFREGASYYSMEAEEYRRKGKDLNEKASMVILERMMRKCPRNVIDFHGLYVKECLRFLDDYLIFVNPVRFTIITGREGNSKAVRPSVTLHLTKKGYDVKDNGACLEVTKRTR